VLLAIVASLKLTLTAPVAQSSLISATSPASLISQEAELDDSETRNKSSDQGAVHSLMLNAARHAGRTNFAVSGFRDGSSAGRTVPRGERRQTGSRQPGLFHMKPPSC
jgi:hypothetical protein